MGVYEGKMKSTLVTNLFDTLDLAELDAEELYEGTVLPMGEVVAIGDGCVCTPEALTDVSLGHGARDPIGVGVAAQRHQDMALPWPCR